MFQEDYLYSQTDSVRQTLCELNKEIRNRWLDFRFQIKFSRQKTESKAFLDDEEIVIIKVLQVILRVVVSFQKRISII